VEIWLAASSFRIAGRRSPSTDARKERIVYTATPTPAAVQRNVSPKQSSSFFRIGHSVIKESSTSHSTYRPELRHSLQLRCCKTGGPNRIPGAGRKCQVWRAGRKLEARTAEVAKAGVQAGPSRRLPGAGASGPRILLRWLGRRRALRLFHQRRHVQKVCW